MMHANEAIFHGENGGITLDASFSLCIMRRVTPKEMAV